MDILFVFAASAAIIWFLRNSIFWVYLWQAKEYRLDRMSIHLLETAQGKSILLSPLSFLKWVGVGIYIFVIFQDAYLSYFHAFVVMLYIFQAIFVFKDVFLSQFRRPEPTVKALSLIGFSIITVMLLFSVPLVDKFFWILFLDRILFLIVAFFVFLHSFPTELYRDSLIRSAIKKLRMHKDLMVIGIAGSYGKSSTKEFVTKLLSKKFSVVKTKSNRHTLWGVADAVLNRLNRNTQLFVVEMGAYGRGEIAQMCYVVRPNIGIVTGINDQHLSLFRSFANSVASKNELIESLPKNGVALFNADDSEVRNLSRKTKRHKVLYGYKNVDTEKFKPAISAKNIAVEKASISFTVDLNNQSYRLHAPLLGSHNIANLLPAIYIADYFGMTKGEITRAVASLTALPNTMIKRTTESGITVIDDTFNSNPESIAAALSYMTIYKKKKFFVLQPMIELGRNAKDHHYRAGKAIAAVCDVVLITNKNYLKEINNGLKDGKGSCEVILGNSNTISAYLIKKAQKGDIIVCEGNEAKPVIARLFS